MKNITALILMLFVNSVDAASRFVEIYPAVRKVAQRRVSTLAIPSASSLDDICSHVMKLTREFPSISYAEGSPSDPSEIRVMFRGQEDKWPLIPGIARTDKLPIDEASAIQHLAMTHPNKFMDKFSIKTLSRAQHYGLRTRLLDFTGNLAVAVFFAVEHCTERDDTGILYIVDGALVNNFSCIGSVKGMCTPDSPDTILRMGLANFQTLEDMKQDIRIINAMKGQSITKEIMEKLRLPIAIYPNMDNRRVSVQDGRFIAMGGSINLHFCEEDFSPIHLDEMVGLEGKNNIINFLRIENGLYIKKQLELFKFNRSSMYGGIDNLTKLINETWTI